MSENKDKVLTNSMRKLYDFFNTIEKYVFLRVAKWES